MKNCSVDKRKAWSHAVLRIGLALMVWQCCVEPTSANSNDEFTRPWESRPYQVQVWICSNNTPQIAAVLPNITTQVMRRAEIADPSAWNVVVSTAPDNWRVRLMESIALPAPSNELATSDETKNLDKVIAVCLIETNGAIRYQVRELDIQTGQWGALFERICPQGRDLAYDLYAAIERVFMPLTRIDRVNDQGEVFVRARAINACLQSDVHDGTIEAIENSPVWVKPEDRFLPIIRRVDKNGDLAELNPIPFTYLTVDSQEGSRLVCQIHSRQRLALGGRSSKRAQKLALVIRPPESSTDLKLVSRSDDAHPLSGYEIYSRRPGATKDEDSEFLGLTDWRGIIEVPPFDEGLRLIYVKRGSRPLIKLPIIPGLYHEVVTPVPDDEARLNAEGIMQGFQIEILNLVAQRELLQAQAKSAIEKDDVTGASEFLSQFQKLESPQSLKTRLADEETRLKNSTLNKRELQRIAGMFQRLSGLVNKNLRAGVEEEIQALIQKAQ